MRMGFVDPLGLMDHKPPATSPLHARTAFGANPGALAMFEYCPSGLPTGSPLVVVLHGCGQTATDYDRGTGWSTLADRFGFAVLAPEQTRANNPNTCFNWFSPDDTSRDGGEAASIRQMIETMIADHAIDRARIFITGLSAGGAMSSAMLAAYPELFAGGAIIAGLPFGAAANMFEALASMRKSPDRPGAAWGDAVRKASSHKGPWPRISVWHGDADSIVAASNAEAIVAQWRDVHGITTPPHPEQKQQQKQERNSAYRRRVWQDAAARPVIEAVTVTGFGHGVPIRSGSDSESSGTAGPFILDVGLPSTFRIAEFFGLTGHTQSVPVEISPSVEPPAVAPSVMPEPALARTPLPPMPMPPRLLVQGRLRQVIVKALRAAGLHSGD